MVNKAIKIMAGFILFSVAACYNCETLEKEYRDDQCILVVEKIPTKHESLFDFQGRKPITKEKCNCKSGTSYRWWNQYQDKIDIGDTIIKKRGELVFNIHKKDTILSLAWECGKTYK